MAELVSKNKDSVTFELDQDDNFFGWLLNSYKDSELDGKLVSMDENMLLSIMNSRSCEVDSIEVEHKGSSSDQTIVLYWHSEDRPVVRAKICLHGPSPVLFGYPHFVMEDNKQKNWIVLSDVEYCHSIEKAKNFVYAKDLADDAQIVHVKYAPQKKLERIRVKEADEGMEL